MDKDKKRRINTMFMMKDNIEIIFACLLKTSQEEC